MTDTYDDATDLGAIVAAGSIPQVYDKAVMDRIRESSPYKAARKRFREQCAKMPHPLGINGHGAPCHICNQPIDYRLVWPHPECWSLDHFKTVKEAPHLIMDLGNWRASHLDCNQRRGTEDVAIDIGTPSEQW